MPAYRNAQKVGKFRAGDFLVISDESGFACWNSDTKVDWKGYKTIASEYDAKHPQLIIYPRQDKISVNNPRPQIAEDDDLTFGVGIASELNFL